MTTTDGSINLTPNETLETPLSIQTSLYMPILILSFIIGCSLLNCHIERIRFPPPTTASSTITGRY